MADLVTVACKIPNGLVLRLFDMVETPEPVVGGGIRYVKQAQPRGEPITVKGPNHPQNEAPRALIVGGYALTPNVPADFWNEWIEANKQSPLVLNNQIYAASRRNVVEEKAAEQEKVTTGLERIDPKNLPKNIKRYEKDAAG